MYNLYNVHIHIYIIHIIYNKYIIFIYIHIIDVNNVIHVIYCGGKIHII